MTAAHREKSEEPTIAVGLVQEAESVSFRLAGEFEDENGRTTPAGEYRVGCRDGLLQCTGTRTIESEELVFGPRDVEEGRFSLETTIGLSFHWQQTESQTFPGRLRLRPSGENRVTVINDVALEIYLTSVICSEMSASSPRELIKAHGVVSRSWLLAQRKGERSGNHTRSDKSGNVGERIRWYDHEAHTDFDVCADDHCQRYHGIERIQPGEAVSAIAETRGQVLTFEGRVCDTRYGKCCGGVTEDFRVAWGNEGVPYLVPVFDGSGNEMPDPPLSEEDALREYLRRPPKVYCNCTDETILNSILTSRDLATRDFFRWSVVLSATRAGELLEEKLRLDLGRIVSLEPVERGLSGRLKRLNLSGEKGSVVIGKELEIRRALSPTHLYSSAFVVDVQGPARRPEAFVLTGAGWGHGVGLCQIGAAVQAWQGTGHQEILKRYYPGTQVDGIY